MNCICPARANAYRQHTDVFLPDHFPAYIFVSITQQLRLQSSRNQIGHWSWSRVTTMAAEWQSSEMCPACVNLPASVITLQKFSSLQVCVVYLAHPLHSCAFLLQERSHWEVKWYCFSNVFHVCSWPACYSPCLLNSFCGVCTGLWFISRLSSFMKTVSSGKHTCSTAAASVLMLSLVQFSSPQ